MRLLIFFGVPIIAAVIFFSGSFPYTLVYDEADLMKANFTGKEPISAEVVECEVQNTGGLSVGQELDTTFRASLKNNTDRFVVISAIGEVFDPAGRSTNMHSQMIVLSPKATENTTFISSMPYTSEGRYRCEMRYAIGRFKY